MFKPVARRLVASEVFDQLRDRILRGEMEPGAALPAERILATLLKVNRNAVREGLKRLEQAGLVAIQQGGATRVLDFRRTAGLELLGTMLRGPDGSIDTRVVHGIVELRTALAPIVGRFAAGRAKKAHVTALRDIVAKMKDADGDTAILAKLALDFWAQAVAAGDNLALELAFNSLAVSYGSVLEHLRHVMTDELRAVDDYEAFVTAVEDHDSYRAAELATRIVSRGEAAFQKIVKVVEAVQTVGAAVGVGAKKGRRP